MHQIDPLIVSDRTRSVSSAASAAGEVARTRVLLLTVALAWATSLGDFALSHAQPTVIGVTNDSVVELDPRSGMVVREIARMPIFGRPPVLVSDGSRVFVLAPGAAKIVSVDLASGESRDISTHCCLAGSAVVAGNQLYALVEDRGSVGLVTLDAATGEEQSFVTLPSGIEAVTVLSASIESPSPTITATPSEATATKTPTPGPVDTRTSTATRCAPRSHTPAPPPGMIPTSTAARPGSQSSGCSLQRGDPNGRKHLLLLLVVPLFIGSARRRAAGIYAILGITLAVAESPQAVNTGEPFLDDATMSVDAS